MAISRRAFGLGLLGLGVAGTGAYLALRDRPELQGLLGNRTELFGFIGGEKEAFLADPDVARMVGSYGLALDARVAGSVEMVREPALLSQNPQFLWPSSSIMVDMARRSGVIAPSVRFADRLTAREAEVVDLAVLGLKNDEIAKNLGIASRTVEVHRLHAMRKLQVEGICQLMWLALTGREAPATWTEAYFREVDTDGEQG
jgi:DNA-binding CsgD family transcriptional regulator